MKFKKIFSIYRIIQNILFPIPYSLNPQKGAVLLPMVLMISAVVSMIGMAGLAVGVALNRSNASIKNANRALEASRAGIADVERRILRDSQWAPVCATVATPSYTLAVGSTVTADLCVNKTGNQYTVQSLGKAGLKQRRLDAVIIVDPITNQVRTQSINENQF